MTRNYSRKFRLPTSYNMKDPAHPVRSRLFFINESNDKNIHRLDPMLKTEEEIQEYFRKYNKKLREKKNGKAINKRNKYDPKGNIMTIESFTPHCLRHTFCSIMYEAGIDVLTAKEQMGHSDVKTTLSIYTHLDKKYKKKNVDKMNIYLASGE